MAFSSGSRIVWCVAYLAALAAVFVGCWLARDWARQTLASDGEQSRWDDYRAKMSAQQAEGQSPVRRHVPRSERPPWLVMLDDRFPVVVAFCWMFTTFFFGFVLLVARGVLARPRSSER